MGMTTTITNEQLLASITSNPAAREQVIQNNLGLVYSTAHRLSNRWDREDAISIGMVGLVRAVDTFDATKNVRFSTYAMTVITNDILTARRTEGNQRKRVDNLRIRTTESMMETSTDSGEINMAAILARANLDERQMQVLACRYGIGRKRTTLAQTAREMGISTARVQQIEMEILDLLRKIVEA